VSDAARFWDEQASNFDDAGGRLVLIEGRWCTGAGLGADELVALARSHGHSASIAPLSDAGLWGGQ
jgi:hypothetical protein